jgi:hypothetical protein
MQVEGILQSGLQATIYIVRLFAAMLRLRGLNDSEDLIRHLARRASHGFTQPGQASQDSGITGMHGAAQPGVNGGHMTTDETGTAPFYASSTYSLVPL